MSDLVAPYRWSASEFLRASEAGVFDHRVELVEGEVWPVVIGDWHGEVVAELAHLLRSEGITVTTSTLPSGDSLPDPDCWTHRRDAEPRGQFGQKLSLWRPDDVLLVVEVSDETLTADLMIKTRVYGSAGYPVYWVVSPGVVYVHTEPIPGGYGQRVEYRRGERLPVPYADTDLAVDELLA